MRILMVCADRGIPFHGPKGASVHFRSLAHALRREGHDVVALVSRLGEATSVESPPGVSLEVIPADRHVDVSIWQESTRSAVRALLGQRHFDAVYERYSLHGRTALEESLSAGLPHLLEVNAPLVDEQRRFRSLRSPEEAERSEQFVLTSASAVLTVSHPLARWAQERGAREERVHVVPNGVDTERMRPSDRSRAAHPCALFLGGLRPWHGLSLLARAFARARARLDELELLVIGDGPGREAFEAELSELGVRDAARLVGQVPHHQVAEIADWATFAVAPYEDDPHFYYCPLKIFEYFALGLPTVASAVGDVPIYVRDGETGWLAAAGDEEALAEAMLEAASDPERTALLGHHARRRACEQFPWSRVAQTVSKIASGLVAWSAAQGGVE